MAKTAPDIIASATVSGGRVHLRDSVTFTRQLQSLPDGTTVEVHVTRRRPTRSQQQNAFYWGVVLPTLAEWTGYTTDELHELCKAKFLPRVLAVHDINGRLVEGFVVGGQTRTLSIEDFSSYLDRIQAWAIETLGCTFPAQVGAA